MASDPDTGSSLAVHQGVASMCSRSGERCRQREECTMVTPEHEPAEKKSYRPRPGPWSAGMAAGLILGILFAFLYPPLAIGMIIVGLAVGAAFSIAFQAAADDIARKRR
jgi:hypothetical protein